MAMTLRLDEPVHEALRQLAALEERSMQDVAKSAIEEYLERRLEEHLIDRVLDQELPRYAEALRRLGE